MANLSGLLSGTEVLGTTLGTLDIDIRELVSDSLKVKDGDAFICLRGGKYDGHDFICVAVQRGARVIICEEATEFLRTHPEVGYVLVRNTRLAAANMWNELCGRPSDKMLFVAVTGTNGKTSTTYFLREIFKEAGYMTGLCGTVRCFIGDESAALTDSASSEFNSMTTPDPEKLYPMLARMADAGVEIVFLEASSHSLAQYRLAPLRFSVGIFLNLTPEHLDYHHTMENYFAAKKRLLDMSDTIVVNLDDDWFAGLADNVCPPAVTFSALGSDAADFRALSARCDMDGGVTYELSESAGKYTVTCPIAGDFTVGNTLAAISAARLFGIKPETVRHALAKCPQIPGRMERLPLGTDFEVFIDYAHTPDALERTLKTLRQRVPEGGRLAVMFGCGGDRDKEKRPEMGRLASRLADFALITGDNSRTENPRAIICDILRGVEVASRCKVIEKRRDAIRYIIKNAERGDVILLAGKGHEDYETDISGKHPFSERETVMDAIREARV